ncbi:MAG: FtsW/RodA/SpoVE family cell cycle protein [Patescibacteria group bacterium]
MSELGARAVSGLQSSWTLLAIPVALSLLGVLTMHTFGEGSFAPRQLLWILLGTIVFIVCASLDMHFLRRTPVIVAGYLGALALLVLVLLIAPTISGAKSWFSFGAFSFQPADLAKLVIIALMAKYFSRRHMEIGHVWHIILSGIYVAIPMGLLLLQPDLGTAAIIGAVWFGLVLVSGISKKHLAVVFITGAVAIAGLWTFGLHEYQRERIVSFLNPAADIHGSGYNAYQAVVAVGSGELFGKGIGYGTQSKLRFLPEYETDFIFAAFAEEWGFVGIVFVLTLFGLLFLQLILIARRAATNFDALFTIGVCILLAAHLFIHAGINLGLLPVTGTTIPFMSYGGSHVLMEFAALGVVASLAKYARSVPRGMAGQEFSG